jgi:hypothetical protein
VRDSALVELHVVDHAVGEGFVLDGTWQASGAFGFRFTRGDELVDLAWELHHEPEGMSVGFTSHEMSEIVALDPNDGARAFELWVRRELTRHLSSPTSLREAALAARVSLRSTVARGLASSGTIREGSVGECLVERSTPSGTGWFDTCTMRMATPEEQRAALASLDARLARERGLILRHFATWHRVIRESFGAATP